MSLAAVQYDHMAESLILANRRLNSMLKVLATRMEDDLVSPDVKRTDLELFMEVRNIQRDLATLTPTLGNAIPRLVEVVKQPIRPTLHPIS